MAWSGLGDSELRLVSTLDERVAYLEGKVEEHSRGFGELRDMVLGLDQKLDRRLDAMDQKVDRLEHRLERGLARLDDRMSRQFLWLLGAQIAVLIAVIGALASG